MSSLARLWHRTSITINLTALISLLVLVVILSLTLLAVQRERQNFHQELEVQARLLLDTLPLMLRDPLYRLEIDELYDAANVVSENEQITQFIVYDAQGVVLVSAHRSMPAFADEVDPLGARLVQQGPKTDYLVWEDEQLIAGRPIYLGNEVRGAVTIGFSTALLEQKIAALTRQSLFLAALTLMVGGAAAALLAHQITTPLSTLADVATRMAGGDRSVRATLQTQDEIGRLGDAFNRMADAVEQREAELQELASSLERTVAERTAELRYQNEALVRANEKLTVARQEAEAANRAKSAVLSMVSHELRTPLTSILGFARMIERRLHDDDLAPEGMETMLEQTEIIVSEGERLLALINSILDLARIESGRAEWELGPVAVPEIIEQALAATAALFQQKSLERVVEIDDDLPTLTGDRNRLVEVVVNLLSNAVKFTDVGTVTCRAWSEDDEIVISVTDTGVGIDPADFDKIFEEFVRVGLRSGERRTGTGLGLPICQRIVDYHGGRIWVESAVGEGSTFYVALPLNGPAA
jgi:signal transduction histidine kinase